VLHGSLDRHVAVLAPGEQEAALRGTASAGDGEGLAKHLVRVTHLVVIPAHDLGVAVLPTPVSRPARAKGTSTSHGVCPQ